MEIQMLVEPVNGNGYRASALTLSAEAATEEEAIAGLKKLIEDKLVSGAKLLTLTVPVHPSMRFRSKRKLDDPVVQEYLEIIAENRRKADEVENPL
jgi:hypothetical protein